MQTRPFQRRVVALSVRSLCFSTSRERVRDYLGRGFWGDCPRGDRIRTPVSYVISASSSLLGSKLISPGSDLSLKVISILAVNFLEQVATAHLTNPGEIMSLATLLTLRECPHGR